MANLEGRVIESKQLTGAEQAAMYALMAEFYDDTDPAVFLRDLMEKDYCILLYDEAGGLQGFSTQQLMAVEVQGKTVHGGFSGDTIIHKEYWGSLELFRLFGAYFVELGKTWESFYWFLISKGYKTYKMLPLFFKEYYPNCQGGTPPFEQAVMDAFGMAKYPEEYDPSSGLILYRGTKDKLKPGVADITDKQLKDQTIRYFLKRNPEHFKGNDLVCLANLTEDNLRPGILRLIQGK